MLFHDYFLITLNLFLHLFGADRLGRSGLAGQASDQVGCRSDGLVRRVAGYSYCKKDVTNYFDYTFDV